MLGRVWSADGRFGLELQASQAHSTAPQVFTPGGPVGPASVRILTVAAQGLFEVLSVETFRSWLSAGGGLVRHGGEAYAPYDSPMQVAGTLGLGSRLRLHRRLNAVLGLTTFFYYLEVRGRAGTVQHGWQADPMVQLGLTWGWP